MNGWSSGSAESPMVGNREARELVPHLWSVEEVAQFLQDSDCGAYTDRFVNKVMSETSKDLDLNQNQKL